MVGQGRGIGAILKIISEIGHMIEVKAEIEKEKTEIEKEKTEIEKEKTEIEKEKTEIETDPVVERKDKG